MIHFEDLSLRAVEMMSIDSSPFDGAVEFEGVFDGICTF